MNSLTWIILSLHCGRTIVKACKHATHRADSVWFTYGFGSSCWPSFWHECVVVVDAVVVNEDRQLTSGAERTQKKLRPYFRLLLTINEDWVGQLHNWSVEHGRHRLESDAIRPRVQLTSRCSFLPDVIIKLIADQRMFSVHHLLVDYTVLLFPVLDYEVASLMTKFKMFSCGSLG